MREQTSEVDDLASPLHTLEDAQVTRHPGDSQRYGKTAT